MKPRFLFPYWCRFLGIGFLVADAVVFNLDQERFYKIFVIMLAAGLLLIAFSKEKVEDEQISRLRLESLQWSVYLTYLLLIISIFLNKGNNIQQVLHFTLKFTLVFFIVRFRWVIFWFYHRSKLIGD